MRDKDGNLLHSLRFKSCDIYKNWSRQNLMQILLSSMKITNCDVRNNYAKFVTSGITMINSNLVVESTLIQLTADFVAMMEAM